MKTAERETRSEFCPIHNISFDKFFYPVRGEPGTWSGSCHRCDEERAFVQQIEKRLAEYEPEILSRIAEQLRRYESEIAEQAERELQDYIREIRPESVEHVRGRWAVGIRAEITAELREKILADLKQKQATQAA